MIRSQSNDSNVTLATTIEPLTSTLFFTTAEDNIDSNIALICVQHTTQNNAFSEWSGEYEIDTDNTINNHRVWSLILDDSEYNILYYNKEEAWIITEKDYDIGDEWIVPNDKIIAMCDTDNLNTNPTSCNDWMVLDTLLTVIMTSINDDEQCNVDTDSGNAGASQSNGVGAAGYAGIGISVGVILICIICFAVYKVRNKESKPTDAGISLQPYVPTGMAYDSYKQNQALQQQVKVKKKKQEKKVLKKPAPTSVASASAMDDGESSNVDSSHALINVFDEDDDNHEVPNPVGTIDEDHNPFLKDGIFQTGTTQQDDPILGSDDLINAFDE